MNFLLTGNKPVIQPNSLVSINNRIHMYIHYVDTIHHPYVHLSSCITMHLPLRTWLISLISHLHLFDNTTDEADAISVCIVMPFHIFGCLFVYVNIFTLLHRFQAVSFIVVHNTCILLYFVHIELEFFSVSVKLLKFKLI